MLLVLHAGPFGLVANRLIYQDLSVLFRCTVPFSAEPRNVVVSPLEQVLTNDRSYAFKIEEMLGGDRKILFTSRSPSIGSATSNGHGSSIGAIPR
jgi:hypothetical protein